MEKPSQESVEFMLNDFECHGVIPPRRDVFDDVLGVLRAYISLVDGLEREKASYQKEIKSWHGKVEALEAENRALMAITDNIYDNIKSLPAGHERFALYCIRKLLKPEEKS